MVQMFERVFNALNNRDSQLIIFIVFCVAALVAIILRVIICAGYQAQTSIMKLRAKPAASRADLEKSRFPLLKNIAADYFKTAEKNISGVHIGAIVEKHMARLAITGWSYRGIGGFVTAMETGLPIAGLALAVIFNGNYGAAYGLTAIAAFVMFRLFAAVFDFALVRDKLANELVEYVEREAGQFYAGDYGSVLLKLKAEITTASSKQTETLKTSVADLKKGVTDALNKSLEDLANRMEDTMSKIVSYGDVLQKPLDDWAAAISAAAGVQAESGDAAAKTAETARLVLAAFEKQEDKIAAMEKLCGAALEGMNGFRALAETAYGQMQYVEKNQAALDASLRQYEVGMEQMTRQLGDGFGGMLDFHARNAYDALNSELAANINRIIEVNGGSLVRVAEMFERLAEQSRVETGMIVNLTERLNMYFEGTGDKVL